MSVWPRVLITGADGQVGRALLKTFVGSAEVIACNRNSLDLANADQIREKVREVAPDIIVNAGAYTAVDRAETEREPAFAVNGRAPGILAEEAQRASALLIHYSTDYVFNGSKPGPWVEDDATDPLSVYGASKLAGEDAIRRIGGKYLIFRTSWVYAPEGKNFVLTMLRLGRERESLNVVDDQIGAPTTAAELARATHAITKGIATGEFGASSVWAGTYHMTCPGTVSWCGFARAIFQACTRTSRRKNSRGEPDSNKRLSNTGKTSAQFHSLERKAGPHFWRALGSLGNSTRRSAESYPRTAKALIASLFISPCRLVCDHIFLGGTALQRKAIPAAILAVTVFLFSADAMAQNSTKSLTASEVMQRVITATGAAAARPTPSIRLRPAIPTPL